jgi:clan AA aspartic protease
MIRGTVNAQREAMVRLVVLGSHGREHEIEAVIDTGYTGLLTLVPDSIAVLNLPLHGRGRAVLADGRETLFDIYEAVVIWDSRPRHVLVDAADTNPLIGMGLLDGQELTIQAWAGGEVRIATVEPRAR